MIITKWDNLPDNMQNEEVKKYYDIIKGKKGSLILKRLFDVLASLILLIILSPLFIIFSIMIKLDSKGPIMFKQNRVTENGRIFKIFKFRTMVENADKNGSQVTVKNDNRVTKIGKFLRKFRLDEIPQLINILIGDMSFVGTRPEVPKYVELYTDEMKATLLMKAGVTSLASIKFKDEEKLLQMDGNIDKIYIENILPQKMQYNLEYLKRFNFFYDIKLMFMTLFAVVK